MPRRDRADDAAASIGERDRCKIKARIRPVLRRSTSSTMQVNAPGQPPLQAPEYSPAVSAPQFVFPAHLRPGYIFLSQYHFRGADAGERSRSARLSWRITSSLPESAEVAPSINIVDGFSRSFSVSAPVPLGDPPSEQLCLDTRPSKRYPLDQFAVVVHRAHFNQRSVGRLERARKRAEAACSGRKLITRRPAVRVRPPLPWKNRSSQGYGFCLAR